MRNNCVKSNKSGCEDLTEREWGRNRCDTPTAAAEAKSSTAVTVWGNARGIISADGFAAEDRFSVRVGVAFPASLAALKESRLGPELRVGVRACCGGGGGGGGRSEEPPVDIEATGESREQQLVKSDGR